MFHISERHSALVSGLMGVNIRIAFFFTRTINDFCNYLSVLILTLNVFKSLLVLKRKFAVKYF